jgi:Plasmid pRiA4b ORF-3-like protein
MRIYRFRVVLDDPSEAFRDIEIKSTQSFKVFHQAIKDAFGFLGNEMASFYLSDEEWAKGQEIPLADMGFAEDGGTTPALMDQVLISDHIRSTRQRFIYVYDFLVHWSFVIELMAAEEPKKEGKYPRVALTYGIAPNEHSRLDPILMPQQEEGDTGYEEQATTVYDPHETSDHDDDEAFGEEGEEGQEDADDYSEEFR